MYPMGSRQSKRFDRNRNKCIGEVSANQKNSAEKNVSDVSPQIKKI